MKMSKKWSHFWKIQKHNAGGFTLVELIVVIAILAILAGVAIPAYSGYIEKANEAEDQQLLAAINTAFAAACAMNGEDNYRRTDNPTIAIGDEGAVAVNALTTGSEKIDASFATFFEGGKFKNTGALRYDPAIGGFYDPNVRGGTGAYQELFNSLKEKYGEEIANKVMNTSLGKIGTDVLFVQMNGAMDLADELNLHTLTGEPFLAAYYEYLGFDPADYESDEAAQEAWDAKLAALGVDDETASTHAIALYAAQNSTNLSTSDLTQWLGSNKTTEDFKASPNANTLAEAAAIYGMYLSYSKETTGAVPEGNTLEIMTKALQDGGFKTWVGSEESSAQKELDAYKTYMNIINDAAKDETARNEILANGFTNPELEDLVKDLMGN